MTEPFVPQLPPEEDFVSGPQSDALLGAVIEYTYSRGSSYRITFDRDHHLAFALLGEEGGFAVPQVSYRARDIRDGLVLVHWIVKQPGIHVSLTIDLAERRIHVAAMMPPNRWEFFDTGEITRLELG